MSIRKEKAIEEVLQLIHQFSTQILYQLDMLEKVIGSSDITFTKNQIDELRKRERVFDQLEVEVSEQIINCIVLHQPVASDLRLMISCYRMSINLERIGDLVMNIVNFIQKMKDRAILNLLPGVVDKMLTSSINMVRKSILSFTNKDMDYALWTIKIDAEVDELNHNLLKKTLSKSDIDKETRNIMMGFIQFNSIISNIERIADHATNIAESSIYAMGGTDLRHKKFPENFNPDKPATSM